MNFTIVSQVLGFIAENKDVIRSVILNIEALVPDAAGASKAAAVKQFIGTSLAIGDQIDAAWPVITPIFNLLVGVVKCKPS